MINGLIYKIEFPNRKNYIGLTTTSLEQRKREHNCCAKNGNTKCLYNALRKYDMVDIFELIQIDTAYTIDELCEKEKKYIIEYNSYYQNDNGYNMTHGGEGSNGYVFTEDDKQKISKSLKKYNEEHPEAREKIGNILKSYYEEHPEAREKQGNILKSYYEDNPEAREKQGEARKKYFEEHPEEKEKHRELLKKYFEEHPEARKKQSESLKKYYADNPEEKEKISNSLKKYNEENKEARIKKGKARKKYYEDNPEAKKKLSDGKGKNKPFDIFTTDGRFIKTFQYQYEAREFLQKEYNIKTILISQVLSEKRKSSAGFIFKYK